MGVNVLEKHMSMWYSYVLCVHGDIDPWIAAFCWVPIHQRWYKALKSRVVQVKYEEKEVTCVVHVYHIVVDLGTCIHDMYVCTCMYVNVHVMCTHVYCVPTYICSTYTYIQR